jgi:hypothetical protein
MREAGGEREREECGRERGRRNGRSEQERTGEGRGGDYYLKGPYFELTASD